MVKSGIMDISLPEIGRHSNRFFNVSGPRTCQIIHNFHRGQVNRNRRAVRKISSHVNYPTPCGTYQDALL